jgi:hypothetical protein
VAGGTEKIGTRPILLVEIMHWGITNSGINKRRAKSREPLSISISQHKEKLTLLR